MRKKFDAFAWRVAGVVVPPLGAAYIRLVLRTVRWEWIGREYLDDALAAGRPFVVAFWHGRIAMMAPVTEEAVLPTHVVISGNKDGELIARMIGRFGGLTIRGSTRDPRKTKDKGGNAVMRTAIERLNAGEMIALTPDGPRGPRMRAQVGVAAISAMTGVPVIPFAWATRRGRVMRGWDRFVMPWPFDRGVYTVGAPILPAGDGKDAIEAHRLAIEAGLNAVTRLADERAGRVPVEPADIA